MTTPSFPFSAVVGADDAKLALALTAVDPSIGGVLLRGDKGSAKTTLARGLAALLPGGAPFVELPVGASEDRLIGSLDVAAALGEGAVRFEAGLLAAAHGGVLYVDEINLLPDHLVDALLDAAATGINRVERDGFSHEHPARFVLVGSMNPEEGELRPQLLDRMGLAVEVRASTDPAERATAVRRRLDFDDDPTGFTERFSGPERELAESLATAAPVRVDDDLLERISGLCVAMGVEGLRGDLVIGRAASALAGIEGAAVVTDEHVRRVAHLALAHRARRHPFDPPEIDPDVLDDALDEHLPPPPPSSDDPSTGDSDDPDDQPPDPSADGAGAAPPSGAPGPLPEPTASRSVRDFAPRRATGSAGIVRARRGERIADPTGRVVGDRSVGAEADSIAVAPTVRAAARRRAGQPDAPVLIAADLHEPVREAPSGTLVVIAVDASGSMGAHDRLSAVQGAVLGLLTDVYQRRDRVALVAFQGDEASIVLRPTGSIEVARARLQSLMAAGTTPLAAGIRAATDVARGAEDGRALLVLITDGRATAGPDGTDPIDAAHAAAADTLRAGIDTIVIDAETGPVRLGLAQPLADAMGAPLVHLDELSADALETTIRTRLSGR